MDISIAALLSIIPQTVILLSNPIEPPAPQNDNLLFYGHIAKYNPTDYLAAIRSRLGEITSNPSSLDLDYAQQIVINSQIALRKYRYFRTAVWLSITAIISPVGSGILYLIVRSQENGSNKNKKSETVSESSEA